MRRAFAACCIGRLDPDYYSKVMKPMWQCMAFYDKDDVKGIDDWSSTSGDITLNNKGAKFFKNVRLSTLLSSTEEAFIILITLKLCLSNLKAGETYKSLLTGYDGTVVNSSDIKDPDVKPSTSNSGSHAYSQGDYDYFWKCRSEITQTRDIEKKDEKVLMLLESDPEYALAIDDPDLADQESSEELEEGSDDDEDDDVSAHGALVSV